MEKILLIIFIKSPYIILLNQEYLDLGKEKTEYV